MIAARRSLEGDAATFALARVAGVLPGQGRVHRSAQAGTALRRAASLNRETPNRSSLVGGASLIHFPQRDFDAIAISGELAGARAEPLPGLVLVKWSNAMLQFLARFRHAIIVDDCARAGQS